MSQVILQLKTVSTLRPYYFAESTRHFHTHFDTLLAQSAASIDLGQLFWNRMLEHVFLTSLLGPAPALADALAVRLDHDLDVQALCDVGKAKLILGKYSTAMPTAAELMFCYRVLSRCATIASRTPGIQVHLARGLVATEYDQYKLSDILRVAETPLTTAVGRCLNDLLFSQRIPIEPRLTVINLRNDGELSQAFLLAALLRASDPDAVIILDASGANEQFDFGQWIPVLQKSAAAVSRYIDYFLPRQDYKATLRVLLSSLTEGFHPIFGATANVVCFRTARASAITSQVTVPPPEEAFSAYLSTLPVFLAAGHRTIVGRLSPAKCHWAACKFCTINSQHVLPRGLSVFDDGYRENFDTLVDKLERDRVESLILMDEALHPQVLLEFARALLSRNITIVYRARCRFTDDLTLDACNILYESGCRYLGLGLEAASPRVNRLVNKHMGAPIDYDGVLHNLDIAGIRMHVYAILGFPTETLEEITETRDFLIRHVQRHRYLTVSANLFHLMKGSAIAREPEAFGITQVLDRGDVALVLGFVEQERAKNEAFAQLSAQRIYQAEFLPDIDDPHTAEALWHFIDQTGMFYVQKVVHSKNPFHELAERRNAPLPLDYIDRHYYPSQLFCLTSPSGSDHALLCDWVTFNYAQVPSWLRDFVLSFDPSYTLRENAQMQLGSQRCEEAHMAFRTLVESGLFIQSEVTGLSPTAAPGSGIFAKGNVPVRLEDTSIEEGTVTALQMETNDRHESPGWRST
jgi:hypothetical protein